MSKLLTDTGVLFHHIPRTGGHWVDWALDQLQLPVDPWNRRIRTRLPRKHGLLSHYHYEYRIQIKRLFAFVRHPIAYYESVWGYLAGVTKKQRDCLWQWFYWHPHGSAARLWQSDFNDWVVTMLERQPCWVSHLFNMYVGPPGGPFVHWVGRTEQIEDDLKAILLDIGYADAVERYWHLVTGSRPVNASRRQPTNWDTNLYRRVLDQEHSVLRRFYSQPEAIGRCRVLMD